MTATLPPPVATARPSGRPEAPPDPAAQAAMRLLRQLYRVTRTPLPSYPLEAFGTYESGIKREGPYRNRRPLLTLYKAAAQMGIVRRGEYDRAPCCTPGPREVRQRLTAALGWIDPAPVAVLLLFRALSEPDPARAFAELDLASEWIGRMEGDSPLPLPVEKDARPAYWEEKLLLREDHRRILAHLAEKHADMETTAVLESILDHVFKPTPRPARRPTRRARRTRRAR